MNVPLKNRRRSLDPVKGVIGSSADPSSVGRREPTTLGLLGVGLLGLIRHRRRSA